MLQNGGLLSRVLLHSNVFSPLTPVIQTEVTQTLGSTNQAQIPDRQEAWILMELQKLRRQIENCEFRTVQRTPLLVDQGASHNLTIRISELEVYLICMAEDAAAVYSSDQQSLYRSSLLI